MFDLFGFWASVTVIITALCSPALLLGFWALLHMLSEILEDKQAAAKLLARIAYKQGYEVYFIADMKTTDSYGGPKNYSLRADIVFVVGTVVASPMIAWLALVIYSDATKPDSLLDAIAGLSSAVAPVLGSLTLLVLVYFGIIIAGRRIVREAKRVNSILKKVEDHANKDSD